MGSLRHPHRRQRPGRRNIGQRYRCDVCGNETTGAGPTANHIRIAHGDPDVPAHLRRWRAEWDKDEPPETEQATLEEVGEA
jgi:hypothetical protein